MKDRRQLTGDPFTNTHLIFTKCLHCTSHMDLLSSMEDGCSGRSLICNGANLQGSDFLLAVLSCLNGQLEKSSSWNGNGLGFCGMEVVDEHGSEGTESVSKSVCGLQQIEKEQVSRCPIELREYGKSLKAGVSMRLRKKCDGWR